MTHTAAKPAQHHIRSPHGPFYETVFAAAVAGMCGAVQVAELEDDATVKRIIAVAHDIAMNAVCLESDCGH